MGEQSLPGGFVTTVVRAGNTVRRAQPGDPAFVHAMLDWFERHGWDGARPILIAVLIAVLAVVAAAIALLAYGSPGAAATQSRTVAGFTSLDLAGSNNVTIIAGRPQSVVVHADRNLIDHVTTQVVAGTLVIGNTGSIPARGPRSVEVSVPSLTALSLSGSGQISATGISTRAVVSGSGLIQVTATTSLDAAVPGSGTIIYSGNPPQVTTSVTGSGTVIRR